MCVCACGVAFIVVPAGVFPSRCVVLCLVQIPVLGYAHACFAGSSTGDPSSWFAIGLHEVSRSEVFQDQSNILCTSV